MKLSPTSHGPVTLFAIDYFASMSQETSAFHAKVKINGMTCTVRNDGHGGCNLVDNNNVWKALEAYAATLPPDQTEHGPLTFTADYLISVMLDNAIVAHDHKRMVGKGFTHYCRHGVRGIYFKGAPSAALLTKCFPGASDVAVLTLA